MANEDEELSQIENDILENEEEEKYETNAEEATSFDKDGEESGFFNRKKVLMALCLSFAFVIGGGFIMNINKGDDKNNSKKELSASAARTPQDFLRSQLQRSLARGAEEKDSEGNNSSEAFEGIGETEETGKIPPMDELPVVTWNDREANRFVRESGTSSLSSPPPSPPSQGRSGSVEVSQRQERPAHFASPLKAPIEGNLFSFSEENRGRERALIYSDAAVNPYMAQNAGASEQAFNESGNAGSGGGNFLGGNSLWIGTVIPGILITGINTDLPGNVIARVTENIYDSRTGNNLLIPQGTILMARYNSSVSYAQKRVQIAWDTLIRPDGYELPLGGAAGVDKKGMAGQEAVYHENWFEYLKAAGIISLFTIANSKMAEEAGRYTNEEVSGGIAQANAEFVSETGNNIVSRAMNIQPTLTVESGTGINILLARNMYLPAMRDYPVIKKYTLK